MCYIKRLSRENHYEIFSRRYYGCLIQILGSIIIIISENKNFQNTKEWMTLRRMRLREEIPQYTRRNRVDPLELSLEVFDVFRHFSTPIGYQLADLNCFFFYRKKKVRIFANIKMLRNSWKKISSLE